MRPNPMVFVCGVPRSGTTLLQRVLNHHPELAVANDTHFIPRALERTDPRLVDQAVAGVELELTDGLADNVLQYHRFRRLGIAPDRFREIRDASPTYQALVGRLYDEFALQAGKSLAGEKTPDYVRRIDLLHGLFPDARFVHIIRDGRDTALSLMQWATPVKGPGRLGLWSAQPLACSALWWAWMVRSAREQVQSMGDIEYLEVRYEQLCLAPDVVAREITNFLGLEFREAMLHYYRGRAKENARGLSAKSAWLAPQVGLRDWRNDMNADQAELFEALAGEELEQLGFERAFDRIGNRTLDIAAECRLWWQENFRPIQKTARDAELTGGLPLAAGNPKGTQVR